MPESTVTANLEHIRAAIAEAARAAGRAPERVRLVAVAKTATPVGLREAWEAGQEQYGHNRVQALEEHHAVLPAAEWHQIGPLQRNKVGRALQVASCIQTIGDLRVATAIQRHLTTESLPAPESFIQVNLTPDDGRYGCVSTDLPALLDAIAESTQLRPGGLMTLAPHGAPEGHMRTHFAQLRELAARMAESGRLPNDPELSMGMTEDFRIAVLEGATLVRIGRAIFPPATPSRDG